MPRTQNCTEINTLVIHCKKKKKTVVIYKILASNYLKLHLPLDKLQEIIFK